MFSFQCQHTELHIIFNGYTQQSFGPTPCYWIFMPLSKFLPITNKAVVNICVHTAHALEELTV